MGRVNIVGAGLSGLSAAIHLAKAGIPCNLISALPSERAQSVLAEGGINAALDTMGEHDTPAEHFADTMKGGEDLADPNAVAGLTEHAPEIVRWMFSLGTPFQMEEERLILRNFGGQKKKRTAYSKSSTGKVLMTALIDEARRWEDAGLIHRFSHHLTEDLTIEGEGEDRCCSGLVIRDTYTSRLLNCPGPVILCSGGMNGIFPGLTTGTVPNTGNLTALVFAKGVEFGNLEFIQYHPTTVGIPGKRMLISEAARGEGGRLFILRDGKPWYFMEEKYPELGNLMPRDVVSREMFFVSHRPDCDPQVYLDLTGLPAATWEKKLSDMREEILHYLSIDPVTAPVPVSPGIHFFMGGVLVDAAHRSSLPGLYAAGECACQYHGANRLGGNSMLGALYGGKVAAESVTLTCKGESLHSDEPVDLGLAPTQWREERMVAPVQVERLCSVLWEGLGIAREETVLSSAAKGLEELLAGDLTPWERNRALLGKAIVSSALARQESRGAHYRTDFPQRDDAQFQKTTVAVCRDGAIDIVFRPIPERRTGNGTNP